MLSTSFVPCLTFGEKKTSTLFLFPPSLYLFAFFPFGGGVAYWKCADNGISSDISILIGFHKGSWLGAELGKRWVHREGECIDHNGLLSLPNLCHELPHHRLQRLHLWFILITISKWPLLGSSLWLEDGCKSLDFSLGLCTWKIDETVVFMVMNKFVGVCLVERIVFPLYVWKILLMLLIRWMHFWACLCLYQFPNHARLSGKSWNDNLMTLSTVFTKICNWFKA